MTRITIITENTGEAEISYRAMAREHEAIGRTAGAALDALTEQLDPAETGTVIVVQKARPDQFFSASQQRRLSELLEIRRGAESGKRPLSPSESAELESLVDAELDGATRRSAAIARELEL